MRVVLLCATAVMLLAACGETRQPVVVHDVGTPPARLGEWGVVLADGERFELNAGVLPYDLNTPLFSDYALKLRSVWMPAGVSAGFTATGKIDFPVGTILSKTFHYEKAAGWSTATQRVLGVDRASLPGQDAVLDLDDYVLIETRLLVRYDTGWRALPYVWNETQDEAYLAVAGDLFELELVGGEGVERIAYVVPDANQCSGCHQPDHSSKQLQPLGPRDWQLNRNYDYAGFTANQLEHWEQQGLLRAGDGAARQGVSWAAPGDATIEQRVKAYLDANCAHCHNARGAADTSALHLDIDAPVDRFYGVCKTPVAVGRGSGGRPFDIYPGRPEDSILLYRMQHSDPAIAMPELGRSTVHREAVELVREWIAGLPGDCQARLLQPFLPVPV
jgi:uncharacterized repeat protein (TIGR03806 family)